MAYLKDTVLGSIESQIATLEKQPPESTEEQTLLCQRDILIAILERQLIIVDIIAEFRPQYLERLAHLKSSASLPTRKTVRSVTEPEDANETSGASTLKAQSYDSY